MDKDQIIAAIKEKVELPDGVAEKAAKLLDGESLVGHANKDNIVKTLTEKLKIDEKKANEIYNMLSEHFMTSYDETANIGKRYRRADVVGTPFCVTIDDETLNNDTVTIRDRDTMKQETIKISELVNYIEERIKF